VFNHTYDTKNIYVVSQSDGEMGTYNLGNVDREGSLECVGTLKK